MSKRGRFGKYGENKRKKRLKIKKLNRSTNLIETEKHRKIAPGHKNMGRGRA